MSRAQVLGYTLDLRAFTWARQGQYLRAIDDRKQSIVMYPESPSASNNLAWMVATKTFPERGSFADLALSSANHAIGIDRSANHLDTLACVEAFLGKFSDAAAHEREALEGSSSPEFESRLTGFLADPPIDCTGAE